MVTANLKGGLGNLMFQIATAFALASGERDNITFSRKVPGNIHWSNLEEYEKTIFHSVTFTDVVDSERIYVERAFHFNEIPQAQGLKIDGYFQSEKYFKQYEEEIKLLFKLPEGARDDLYARYASILQDDPVAVHVRRGDYMNLQNIHPPCNPQFFRKAMKEFPKGTKFLIFSDDIEWCRKIFKRDNFMFVEGNADYEDLTLFSMCKNHILSNSTFGWWGAWLSSNEGKKVIAPKAWFGPGVAHNTKDLIPEDWITI